MSVRVDCDYAVVDSETGPRCCERVVCDPGHEAVMCTEDDPTTSHCQKCAHNTYRSDSSVLGRNDGCLYKRMCRASHMTYLFPGNETANSICTCDPGYQLTSDGHLCLPAPTSLVTKITTPSGPASSALPPSLGPTRQISPATLAVGVLCGILFVILVIVLVFCLWRRRRRRGCDEGQDVPDSKVMYYRVQHNDSYQILYEKVAQAKDYRFHAEVIDGKAMEVLESKLGRSLGPFIRQLYRQMGQADAATRLLDEIQLEPVPEERAHRALQAWRQAAGRAANVESIRHALLDVNRKDLVDELYAWISAQPLLVRKLDEERARSTDENKNINRALSRISIDNGSVGTEV